MQGVQQLTRTTATTTFNGLRCKLPTHTIIAMTTLPSVWMRPTSNTKQNSFAVDAPEQCPAALPCGGVVGRRRMATTMRPQKRQHRQHSNFSATIVQQKRCVHLRPNCSNSNPVYSSSSPISSRCRHTLSPNVIVLLTLLMLFTVGCPMSVAATPRARRTLPLGMDRQMFPAQIFDENAPICTVEREPCGFYSFSLDGKAPLKWIKSWCRCSDQYECAYERTDMRMRVYRQTCIAHDDLLEVGDEDNAAQQRQSVVLVDTVPSSVRETTGHARSHRHHNHHHRHVTTARHSRKAHRQRQIIRRLRAIIIGD